MKCHFLFLGLPALVSLARAATLRSSLRSATSPALRACVCRASRATASHR